MRRKGESDRGLRPVTLSLGTTERRFLLELAGKRSLAENRPVSVSEAARALLAQAMTKRAA